MRILASLLLLLSTSVFAASGSGNVSNVIGLGGAQVQSTGNTTNSTEAISASSMFLPEGSLLTSGSSGSLIYKTLVAKFTNTSAEYNIFVDLSAGNGTIYQVPAGKKFVVVKTCFDIVPEAGGLLPVWVSSATASFTDATTTPPTGWVSKGLPVITPQGATNGNYKTCLEYPWSIGSSLYPGITSTTDVMGQVFLIGKEVNN